MLGLCSVPALGPQTGNCGAPRVPQRGNLAHFREQMWILRKPKVQREFRSH